MDKVEFKLTPDKVILHRKFVLQSERVNILVNSLNITKITCTEK